MLYREGFGFVVNESEQQEMNRIGIGRPPVVAEQVQEQQQVVQPVQQVPVQNEQMIRIPQLSEEEINKQSSDYMNKVLGRNVEQKQVVATPVVETPKQNDNPFGSWFEEPPVKEVAQVEQQAQQSNASDPVVDYRRGIVQAAVRLGKNPEDIEKVIASITPEEYVIFASIKAEHENKAKQTQNEQVSKPIVFNSLKPKPTPTIATAPSSEFNTQKIDQFSVIGSSIKNRFY